MSGVVPQLLLVGVLVLVNAAFAGTELALVSLREGQLQRLESESKRGALLARLARDPNRFLATIQVGITLAGFLASAAAAVSLAEPLQDPLSFLGKAAEPVSIVVVTLVLAYLTLVFGELTPKRLAMQRAEKWGLAAARPLAFVSTLTRPAVVLLSWSTDIAVRLLGGDPDAGRDEVTQEELRELVATQSLFTPQQRLIIDGAFEIAERSLQPVLRPRPDVFVARRGHPGRRGARRTRSEQPLPCAGGRRCEPRPRRGHRAPPRPAGCARPACPQRVPAHGRPSRGRRWCSMRSTNCRSAGSRWRWSSTNTVPRPASSRWRT